ncbi:MAG: acyltransferase [Burkholderiales bacterium]|nr:acyltransferase [Burkholderiales bacterium]
MKTDQRYDGIQALRFVAALMVVLCHATLMVSERLLESGRDYWHQGTAGVDVFFVVSGFVMAISSQGLLGRLDGWREFVRRRVVRIVPLYWIVTSLKIAMLLAIPAVALRAQLDPVHVIGSYLFLPVREAGGMVRPLVSVGWTLTFEMFFYAWFAFAMMLRVPPLKLLAPVFLVLAGVGLCIGDTHNLPAAATFYLNPMVLEFVAGMWLAEQRLRGATLGKGWSLLLVVLGFASILIWDGESQFGRLLFVELPALMIVAGVVFLEPVLRNRIPKALISLGDASYALYLFHTFSVPVIGIVMRKLGWLSPLAATVISTLVSVAVCWLIHLWIERPITERLKGRKPALPMGPTPVAAFERLPDR